MQIDSVAITIIIRGTVIQQISHCNELKQFFFTGCSRTTDSRQEL